MFNLILNKARILLVTMTQLALLSSCATEDYYFTDIAKEEPPIIASKEKSNFLPGRYVGFFRFSSKKYKVPLTLDLLATKVGGKTTVLKGVAKFLLEDFSSYEYSSLYFSKVTYGPNHGILKFFPEDSAVRFTNAKIRNGKIISATLSDKSGALSGELMVIYSGKRIDMDIDAFVGNIYPQVPVLPRVGGVYSGRCGMKNVVLQLETAKWGSSFLGASNFLEGYKILGRWGTENEQICHNSEVCAINNFSSGRLQASQGKLFLKGQPRSLECDFVKGGLKCNQCELARRIVSSVQEGNESPKVPQRVSRSTYALASGPQPLTDFREAKLINGRYSGFLHNEARSRYQKVTVVIDGKKGNQKTDNLAVNLNATLHFGSEAPVELLAYNLLANVPRNARNVVFDGPGESFFQVSYWRGDGLRGIWYSKNFGRVGTLEVIKDADPQLEDDDAPMEALSGKYLGTATEFELWAGNGVSQTKKEFFPLNLRGIVRDANDKNTAITNGRYDFYSGRINLQLEDGRLLSGLCVHNGTFSFYWPAEPNYGAAMKTLHLSEFKYFPPSKTSKRLVGYIPQLL